MAGFSRVLVLRVGVLRRRRSGEAARRRLQGRHAPARVREDAAVVERRRRLEAWGELVLVGLAGLEGVLRVLQLSVRALEALDSAEHERTRQGVGLEVRVAACPGRRLLAVLVRLERASLDDAHLRLAPLTCAVVRRED